MDNILLNNNYYQIYDDEIFALVRSFVIKSVATANHMNIVVSKELGLDVNLDDMATWRYYMNIAGEYHPADEMMTVTSADTSEVIEFTKETLERHSATKKLYQLGSLDHIRLGQRYPDQKLLINGVLTPVDKKRAIEVNDWTLLSFDRNYVEENEATLIHRVQEYIDVYVALWYNSLYSRFNPLYDALAIATLTAGLLGKIKNIRLNACRTSEAHSFHVRQYLTSFGLKDSDVDALNAEQRILLYKEIPYIKHKLGHTDSMSWLIDTLLTKRQIPLIGFDLKQNHKEIGESLYPKHEFKVTALNAPALAKDGMTIDLPEFLTKEEGLAPGNTQLVEKEMEEIDFQFASSPNGQLQTKLLESNVVDYASLTPYDYDRTMVNHWLWLASLGYYDKTILPIDNHLTGELIPLNTKDAFVLFLYCYLKVNGESTSAIPELIVQNVQREVLPTREELLNIVDYRYVKDEWIDAVRKWHTKYASIVSVDEFKDVVDDIYYALLKEHHLSLKCDTATGRAQVFKMSTLFYTTLRVRLEDEDTSFEEWLFSKNISLENFEEEDYEALMMKIYQLASGQSGEKELTIADVQKAMLGIFTSLSSYSIQINKDAIKPEYSMVEIPSFSLLHEVESLDQEGLFFLPGIHVTGMDDNSKQSVKIKGYHGHVISANSIEKQGKYVVKVGTHILDYRTYMRDKQRIAAIVNGQTVIPR